MIRSSVYADQGFAPQYVTMHIVIYLEPLEAAGAAVDVGVKSHTMWGSNVTSKSWLQ